MSTAGTYSANDTFRIEVSGSQVTYFRNGAIVYASTQVPTLPLLFGASLYTKGATIDNAMLSSGSVWQDEVGVSTSGNSMTKTGPAGWNSGAASIASLAGVGSVTFTTAENNTDKVVGLSHNDPAQDWAAIDYGINLTSNGRVNIIQSGVVTWSNADAYIANDVFEIRVSGPPPYDVTYYRNGHSLLATAYAPTLPLLFGTSLYTPGATVNDVSFAP